MSKNHYLLNLKPDLKDRVYKLSNKNNKSLNKTINRLINHALMDERTFFEFQYLDKGEIFIFKADIELCEQNNKEAKHPKKNPIKYRFMSIDKETGASICKKLGGRIPEVVKFKFSENFYKPVTLC